jgi:hypothetical protein
MREIEILQQLPRKCSLRAEGQDDMRCTVLLIMLLFLTTGVSSQSSPPQQSPSSHTANAVDYAKPLFIHAACDGKTSSAVLAALKEEIRSSTSYRLVPGLDDNGRMDVVLTIYMNCSERSDVAAVATTYGIGRCFSSTDCRGSVDGASIRAALCDSSPPTECGRELFKRLDEYAKHPNPARLELEPK